MRVNPAVRLEELGNKIEELLFLIDEAQSDDESTYELKNELDILNSEFDMEFDIVIDKYYELFQEYYFSTEDLQHMFDLNIQMVAKRMTPEIDSIHFSKIIRRYIKSCRIMKSYDRLELLLYKKGINIDNKIFFSRTSIKNWLKNHVVTKNGNSITADMINALMEEKSANVLMSTNTYKKKMCFKYDMQLKRAGRERIYFKMMDGNNRMLSRIPVDIYLDNVIRKVNEL